MRRLCKHILSRASKSSGVTLVELMVSLFVFSIGFLAVMAMCLMSIQSNSLINRMTQANLLAQDKMEELLVAETTGLFNDTETVGNYTRSWVIVDDPVDSDDKWITVTINWTDNKGDHQMQLKSFARNP